MLAGDHARAGQLVQEYSEALQALWLALPEGDRASSDIPRQACELLAWAREMTLVQRALTSQHLAIVETASRYKAAAAAQGQSSAIEVHA